MNILPFVTILILVISLTISSFFTGFKETSFAKIGSAGLINAYRQARNSSEEVRLLKYSSSLLPKETTDKPKEKREAPQVRKTDRIPFRENITDNSKLNLTPILKSDNPFLEEVLVNLITELYLHTEILKGYKYDKKAFPKLLVKELLQAANKFTDNKEIHFEKLILKTPTLHTIWYKMLKGSSNYPAKGSWPEISRYTIFLDEKETAIIKPKKASVPLLKAFFGKDISTEILTLEKDPNRKRQPLTKAEIEKILQANSFPEDKLPLLSYTSPKIMRCTESEIDPATGITATITYSPK